MFDRSVEDEVKAFEGFTLEDYSSNMTSVTKEMCSSEDSEMLVRGFHLVA